MQSTTTKSNSRLDTSLHLSSQSKISHYSWVVLVTITAVSAVWLYRQSLFSTRLPLLFLPESYAVCAKPGYVYTVDKSRPLAECILIRRDKFLSIGSIGSYLSTCFYKWNAKRNITDDVKTRWDIYQTELIQKFYGNEPSAKKPLNLLHLPANSIVIPGIHGTLI